MKEEQIILKGLQQGSEQAYKDLFTAYFSDLVLYANHFIKNQAAAEDIVQDFFITLWLEKKFFNIESSLEGYLYRSLHNTCLNHLHNEQRKQEKLLHMPIEKDSSPTLTTELEDKEREYNQLYQALHKLPEQCKQVFTLCCLQNMKYQEAADYLGISINTVRTQMGRAYKILRNSLDSKSFLNLLFLRFLK
jgi:RNA polymerase sigma-70 factor|nr:RNA polymerase sigma-70 factor [Odoribacter splanchnicus]